MPWYAVDDLDDAFDATKALLAPLDARQWLELAFVVFFLGGASGGPTAAVGGSTDATPGGPATGPTGVTGVSPSVGDVLPIVVALVALAVMLGLAYALAGSIMEFVFVESLRRRRVGIRQYADQHFERGLRLFGFRVMLGLAVALPAAGVAVAAVSAATGRARVGLGLFAVFVPLLVLLGFVVGLVDAFTTSFVVPVMILRNAGVLAGWRQFWPVLVDQWDEYAVYALVRLGLLLVLGAVASAVAGVVGAVLFAPLAVVGAVSLPVLGGPEAVLANPTAVAVAVVLLVAYLVVLAAVLAVILVPVQAYVRYHALLVLGDTDSELDLIPELRRAVREGG